MAPPTDRDVVMAPPQFQSPSYPPPQQNIQKPQADVSEKYKKLKRKFFDLEEVWGRCLVLFSHNHY
jgi:hypothetical protein